MDDGRGGDMHADGILDPESAMEHLSAWKGRIDKLATDTREMSERLALLRVTAADGNGMVEVTVDSTGALVDLWLGRRVQRVDPDVTARTIMETVQVAKEQ